jgi:hypothetical protein
LPLGSPEGVIQAWKTKTRKNYIFSLYQADVFSYNGEKDNRGAPPE